MRLSSETKLHPGPYRRSFRFLFFILISCVYIFFLANKIDLSVSDLGRHLKNGELFFKNFYIPRVNLYSYTCPDFPFVNHHWGSGVIFFLIQKLCGFPGLSVFFITLSFFTFLIFFHIAQEYSSFEIAALVSLFAIPNLISRLEIRPEIFTYFFCGLFFWILWNYRNGRLKWKWLFLLPALELFWVNLHVYFFVGLLLVSLFFLEQLFIFHIYKKEKGGEPFKKLAITLGLSALAALINPSGVSGALYPLKIFSNYGMGVFENLSFVAITRIMRNEAYDFQPLFYFKLAFCLLVLSWALVAIRAIRRRGAFSPLLFSVAVFFSLMAFLALRNYAIFAYFALAITSINLGSAIKKDFSSAWEYCVIVVLFLLISFNLFAARPSYWRREAGIGLREGDSRAIDFFRKERIRGPLLNNYDLGNYLIYYLYPDYRVFVDNRPEAYPADFFKNVYMPLQEDGEAWRKIDGLYKFNAILFNPHVNSPSGQGFLLRRVLDPLWAAVYVDDSCIIFLKRNGPNQGTIQRCALPAQMFLPQKKK